MHTKTGMAKEEISVLLRKSVKLNICVPLKYKKTATPYGYLRQNKKLIVNPKEAEEIRSIFETYLETCFLAETYRMLKERNVKSKFGKNFSKTIIAHLLRNPVYIGKIKHNNQLYDGIREAIISEEIFALAQKIHKERRKKFRV